MTARILYSKIVQSIPKQKKIVQSIPKHKNSTVQEDSAVHTQTQHEDRHRVYAMQALWLPAKPDIISSLCYFTADCTKRVH